MGWFLRFLCAPWVLLRPDKPEELAAKERRERKEGETGIDGLVS
jgi:hypothetical protein